MDIHSETYRHKSDPHEGSNTRRKEAMPMIFKNWSTTSSTPDLNNSDEIWGLHTRRKKSNSKFSIEVVGATTESGKHGLTEPPRNPAGQRVLVLVIDEDLLAHEGEFVGLALGPAAVASVPELDEGVALGEARYDVAHQRHFPQLAVFAEKLRERRIRASENGC